MHKYIRKAAKQQTKSLKISSQLQESHQNILSQLRKLCQIGQKIPVQKLKDALVNLNLIQKQKIINELLMCGQVKLIHNLVKQKTLNKQEIIDSNKQLKNLYETLLIENLQQKKNDKNKQKQQIDVRQDNLRTDKMTKKQIFLRSLKKIFYSLKKMNPTYIGAVLGIIFILLLLRKFKGRIVPFLKSILNV